MNKRKMWRGRKSEGMKNSFSLGFFSIKREEKKSYCKKLNALRWSDHFNISLSLVERKKMWRGRKSEGVKNSFSLGFFSIKREEKTSYYKKLNALWWSDHFNISLSLIEGKKMWRGRKSEGLKNSFSLRFCSIDWWRKILNRL